MPFKGFDPTGYPNKIQVSCPDDLIIPMTDPVAWQQYEDLRWIYNKMEICRTQNIKCAPYGIYPEIYPVFLKPIHNLKDISVHSFLIQNENEYDDHFYPGSFWMEFLDGDHLSIDLVVIQGRAQWSYGFKGKRAKGDIYSFEQWNGFEVPDNLMQLVGLWSLIYLKDYTGCVNFEIIHNRIVKCHLRLGYSAYFGDKKFFEAIIKLYSEKSWEYDEKTKRSYVIPVYEKDNKEYDINKEFVRNLQKNVHSIFIDDIKDRHQDPEGNIRVATINSFDLKKAIETKEELLTHLW